MPRTKNSEAGTAVEDKAPPAAETGGRLTTAVADREMPDEGARAGAPPTYDEIARRAYELYQQRGGTGGQDWDDWLRAETELREGRGRRDDEI